MMIPRRLRAMLLPMMIAALLASSGCARSSSSDGDDEPSTTAASKSPVVVTEVATRLQVFHVLVAGFGTLNGDSRSQQILNLPQSGQVGAVHVVAGRRVKRGELLLQLDTDPTARSGYQQATNALQLARSELARTERLAGDHLATASQLASARRSLSDAEAVVQQQTRLGGASDQADLRAPSDGIVTSVSVHPGERVQAGVPLAEFTASSTLVAQIGIEPTQAVSVHPGMPATIRLVYGTSQPLPGRVTMVADAIDPQTHLLNVLIEVQPIAAVEMVAGAPLSGTIDAATFSAWAVPRDAVLSDANGSYVFQNQRDRAHRVPVKVLAPNGDTLGVSGALHAGDKVITLGAYELTDGDRVQLQTSGENKE